MDALLADLRRAVRLIRTSPGLLAVSVLSLGLGTGVNLTLFTAIRAVFFYQPTLADADRAAGVQPGNSNQFSWLNYRDLRDSGIFERVAGYRDVSLNVRTRNEAVRVDGIVVTPDFFEAIRVPLEAGQAFAWRDVVDREPRVAVVSHAFARRHFEPGAPVVGEALTINGEPFTLTGVLPDGYRAVARLSDPDVYVPISRLVLPTLDERVNGNALNVLGWLRPGATRQQAQIALTTLGRTLEARYPISNREMGRPSSVLPLDGRHFGNSPTQIVVPAALLSLFGLIVLSASANVAGLLLARAAYRRREIAVRTALGASRHDLVRMMLVESFTLAGIGAAAGALLAMWLTSLLTVVAVPGAGAVTLSLRFDGWVLAYAVFLVLGTGFLCGILPAWRGTKPDVIADMQRGESHVSTGRLRLRHAFVVGQVAVCAVLLVLSSLMLRSLFRITSMDPGFDMSRDIVATVYLDAARYAEDGGLRLGRLIVERLDRVSGVRSSGFANILALGNDSSVALFEAGGRRDARAFVNSVSPRYFATLGIPIVRGRDFDARDRVGSPPVAIVTQAFARAYFPGQDAVGKRIRPSSDEPYAEIIAVVGDHKYESYGEQASPIVYSAYAQRPRVSTQVRPVIVHVRTTVAPAALLATIKGELSRLDATSAIDVRTMRDAAGTEPALRRFGSQLLGWAGALGLLLASIGLYGMMAFVVTSRASEIGIRMALGATTGRILGEVVARGAFLVTIGIAIGAAAALLLSFAVAGVLAGLSPADPISFGVTAMLLLAVGLAACYMPARRAARLDPLAALRRL